MLQKILVVLLGFVMSLVGALAPSGLFASTSLEGDADVSGAFASETLATVDAFGTAFIRVPTLWIEVDGRRVTDDAWGTGDIRELKFKVGVRDVEDKSLALGERRIGLHPTDVITIRLFRGDFAYRDVGLAGATLQLHGEVKTTLVKSGEAGTKVRTQILGSNEPTQASSTGSDSLAYVVLGTGAKVETVEVSPGGRRLFTEEASTTSSATGTPGNLLARWVKIDGKPIREYTWGSGTLGRIEFEPAAASTSVVVAFDGRPAEFLEGQTIVVRDFVGEYTIYHVTGGNLRIRLDGFAANTTVVDDLLDTLPTRGSDVPNAAFEMYPPNPRTTDTVQFTDRSSDADGDVVFVVWDFGDGSTSTMREPTHRFTHPGIYAVTLRATDDDLRTGQVTRNITVRNALPVPDFDFSPKIVTTDTLVTFSDRSIDTDGSVEQWQWDFGNGNTSTVRNPQYRFATPGNATVTLTVTDNSGEQSTITKLLIVRNAPPVAVFDYAPVEPLTGVSVQFIERSSDRDGHVVDWRWDFGDGTTGAGANPQHAYARPGTYTVTLTAIDDKGDRGTTSQPVNVRNRPAVADFVHTPLVPVARQQVTFQSLAQDPDGQILHQQWQFEGAATPSLGPTATFSFPAAGVYWVNLSVVDSNTERSWINKTVTVNNSAPVVRFGMTPNGALRNTTVFFTDLSTDPDGDALVAWSWAFGDGATSTAQNPTHQYTSLGNYTVTLVVTDSAGRSSQTSLPMRIQNARPIVSEVRVSPGTTTVGSPVYLNATAIDHDLPAGQFLTYRWSFSDGVNLTGAHVVRSFSTVGSHEARLVVTDPEGAESNIRIERLVIDFPLPVPAFAIAPTTPSVGVPVAFHDASTSPNGNITSWRWDFGDGTFDTSRSPMHTYAQSGERAVTLTVVDAVGKSEAVTRVLRVNAPPVAGFDMDRSGTLPRGTVVQFSDTSTDAENAIVAWRWNYGDGSFENYSVQANPQHTFTLPGTHTVVLEVEDDAGARSTFARTISIQNLAPSARFTHSPAAPVRGSAVQFADLSTDPDGTPIRSWSWSFGDGTTSTQANPVHTYASSGRYLVSLRVSDGQLNSPVDPQSFALVDVLADHDLTLRMTARLPDGRPVDLSAPSLAISVVKSGGGTTSTVAVTRTASEATAFVSANDWRNGHQFFLSMRNSTFMTTFLQAVLRPTDATTELAYEFVLPMPLAPTIEVDPGTRSLLTLGDSTTVDGIPVYRDPWEPFHGRGFVNWTDGVAADSARVDVEVRYVPLSLLGNTLSGDDALLNDLLGWCTVSTGLPVAVDGSYTWSFEPRLAGCVAEGPFLPGVYQVRAVASHPAVVPVRSAPATLVSDPTGLVIEAIEARSVV